MRIDKFNDCNVNNNLLINNKDILCMCVYLEAIAGFSL